MGRDAQGLPNVTAKSVVVMKQKLAYVGMQGACMAKRWKIRRKQDNQQRRTMTVFSIAVNIIFIR